MSVRGRGHVADPAGHMVTSASRLLGAPKFPGPMRSVFLETAPIYDQGGTSSCVGYATARGVHTSLGAGIPFPDPVELYKLARAVDRSDMNAPLRDEGSMPNAAMRALGEWGASPWTASDEQKLKPASSTTVNDEPTFADLEAAASFQLKGYYRIDDSATHVRMARIAQAIDAGIAVPFAVLVDQAFEDNDGLQLGAPDPAGILGGHYICAIGYETSASGLMDITFANSWSFSWGAKGFGRGGSAFFDGASDIYAMKLQIVA